jgi:hypothetical protein
MAAGHDLQKRGGGESGGLVSLPAPRQVARRDLSGLAHSDSVSPFCGGFCMEYPAMESGTRPRRRSAELRVVRVPCLCHSEVAMRTRSTHVSQRVLAEFHAKSRLLILFPIVLLGFGCSRPVGRMSQEDYQGITNVIRAETTERIVDIRLHDDHVVVDTSRDRAVDHCYELRRTRDGWKIVWKGT